MNINNINAGVATIDSPPVEAPVEMDSVAKAERIQEAQKIENANQGESLSAEETKQITDALSIPIAGGEQEPSMRNFRWLIGNRALDIVQPDMFYFGGMIRSMKVARMGEALGMPCVPHISGSGLGYLYMMHFVSAVPNAGPFHEFKGFNRKIPLECATSGLESADGVVTVPSGPGLGVEIDPEFITKHKLLTV